MVDASSAEPAAPAAFRDIAIVGGGCYGSFYAAQLVRARARVAAQLTRAGAQVLEAPPDILAAACVGAYLRAKARSRR